MAKSGFEWVIPPTVMQENIRQYGGKAIAGVKAVADKNAAAAQNEMRQNARWTDRTGNARSGLFSGASMAGTDTVEIVFSHGHTIDYGIHLETGHGGKYAIIAPTLQRYVTLVRMDLQNLFK